MAEKQEPVNENDNSGGIAGMVGAVFSGMASMAAGVWNAVMADGTIEAAGRQGLGELGQALKAFPDSIQVQEPGTIFNPTQGEIAADREDGIGRSPWPSEIAEANRNQPSNNNGRDTGYDTGYSM